MPRPDTTAVRFYTCKSTEEGLDQDFNSLDAQREACAAYITSQGSLGWKPLPQHYDDGGISGGHMDRPALLELLQDIKAGKIDTVVVYKIDRLTRSLADFSKMVGTPSFDQHEVSFVSVTQQFNTTTSMGRLDPQCAFVYSPSSAGGYCRAYPERIQPHEEGHVDGRPGHVVNKHLVVNEAEAVIRPTTICDVSEDQERAQVKDECAPVGPYNKDPETAERKYLESRSQGAICTRY